MRLSTASAFTVSTRRNGPGSDPFRVVVSDNAHNPVVEMSAMSVDHARQVAESLAILLPILRPGQDVVMGQGFSRV